MIITSPPPITHCTNFEPRIKVEFLGSRDGLRARMSDCKIKHGVFIIETKPHRTLILLENITLIKRITVFRNAEYQKFDIKEEVVWSA